MANNSGVKNSWSLVAFRNSFGKCQLGEFVNSDSGEKFKALVFSNGTTRTFVSFSKKLGELTPAELKSRKENLQVVENEGSRGQTVYTLCNIGENSWQDVDL